MKNLLLLLALIMAYTNYASADDFQVELETELEALMEGEEVLEPEERAFASSDKAPAPFTDSDIKRTLKDGKVQKFDGNKYMIVRRGKSKPAKKQVVVKEKEVVKPRSQSFS